MRVIYQALLVNYIILHPQIFQNYEHPYNMPRPV